MCHNKYRGELSSMSYKDTLAKIKEKRKILEKMLTEKNIDIKNKKVLEASKELDVLIIEYIRKIRKNH